MNLKPLYYSVLIASNPHRRSDTNTHIFKQRSPLMNNNTSQIRPIKFSTRQCKQPRCGVHFILRGNFGLQSLPQGKETLLGKEHASAVYTDVTATSPCGPMKWMEHVAVNIVTTSAITFNILTFIGVAMLVNNSPIKNRGSCLILSQTIGLPIPYCLHLWPNPMGTFY